MNGVVKGLNVGENNVGSLLKGVKMTKVQALTFEATEEIFVDSVVIGITLAAHALDEPSR